ncbi:protein-tyrosine phosphatase [Dysgonomonas sp. PH5-37]|uniref:tyrosine-protein phosphatase n=2 Tax=unclassified Dysgonomonas TaxID=2630389 RepID=UPI0024764264|nr:tyrosine-protein phosphatase [Dysgonomonas sp. PH5-37]MDH6387724.1 protein-tyrosine phosphatase [Dysgonomonas sp. PH5-37]
MIITTNCANKTTPPKAEYSGKDISGQVSIVRDKETKEARLKIETEGKWTVYAGHSPEKIDMTTPVAEGEGSGEFSLHVSNTAHSYFQIVTPDGKAILAERHLPMEGGYNFRDLGGFRTQDGRYVKWGKLFRSDDLSNLTDPDLHYLASIPIVSIVDFRAETEVQKSPDREPSSVKTNYKLPIIPGNLANFQTAAVSSETLMTDMNRLLVSDTASIGQYKELFRLLQNPDDTPLLFHCSAGKDRTGLAAALILFALGVDDTIIMDDYLSSNAYLGNKYADIIARKPAIRGMFEVRAEYLSAALEQIRIEHGSIENFLTKVLDVDIQKMKDLYLY